jgi:hypothetical protein
VWFSALFALVYVRSLTFVYIEGDDAMSVAYHAMGRVRALQPAYSPYQSMMDMILRLLPTDEPLLRVFAIALTSIGAPLLVLLIARLAIELAGDTIALSWPEASLLIPLIAPEFLYLGLVYTPALLAMSAAVGAHLLVRRARIDQPRFWISLVLFGVGTACRWDMVAYGAVVAADLAFGPGLPQPRRERIRTALVWGASAIASWFLCLLSSGYGLPILMRTLLTAGPMESFAGVRVVAATVQTLATPAFVLFFAAGLLFLVRRRKRIVLLMLVGIVVVVPYLEFGVPKWLLVAVPGLVVCALVGFSLLWRTNLAVRAALAACIAAPWFFGVHATFGDSAYGPGFQVQPFDRASSGRSSIRPVAGAGALIPTSEGPRPLGGHAWVLLGGGWRKNAIEGSEERSRAIHEAIDRRLPLLADLGQGYAVATLAAMRFTTSDSWRRVLGPSFVEERRFRSPDGSARLNVLRLRDRESLYIAAGIARLEELSGSRELVIYGYTSTLRRCYLLAPDALESLGATAAVVDLEKLRRGAAKMTASAAAHPE